jgi:MFS transporter, ACDE family, multidrug resistance protein
MVGGFIGPFGGSVTTPMLPELRDALHTDLTTVAASMTAYLVPFAVLMLVSGTLAEAWGRSRTVRSAYLAYAVGSIGCAAATSIGPFLAARALQGAANAFTTPLLVAALAELVPPGLLAAGLGRFGGWQAAGQALAPLLGGLAGTVDYRWAFVASAVAATALALVPPPNAVAQRPHGDPVTAVDPVTAGEPGPGRSRWRSLRGRRLVIGCAAAFGLYLTTSGLMLLVALLGADRFGLGSDARGLVIACFGIAGLATGGRVAGLAHRWGTVQFGIVTFAALGVATAVTGEASTVVALALFTAIGGVTSTAGRVTTNTLAVSAVPHNRAGAVSMTMAWQFLGSALAPLLLVPLYQGSIAAGFAVAGVGALGGAALLTLVPRPGHDALPDQPSGQPAGSPAS